MSRRQGPKLCAPFHYRAGSIGHERSFRVGAYLGLITCLALTTLMNPVSSSSLNHLVRTHKQRLGDLDAERLGSF